MTIANDRLQRRGKIVVFFDICSSTSILEALLRTENEQHWRDLIIGIKGFLFEESEGCHFAIYKFLGDGWVLLFDRDKTKGPEFMRFLRDLDRRYQKLFGELVDPVLAGTIDRIGITAGVDSGTLVRIVMNQQEEYIGRALNVAARLQGSIGQKDDAPEGKILVSNNAFAELKLHDTDYSSQPVERDLKNISDGKRYRVRKILLRRKAGRR